MKKLLTLLLALLLTLGLTAPALAFTSDDTEDDDMPYELSIYLVEYDDNDFFGIASLPMSDRGYAKNEIVAAVVELYVPEDEVIAPPEYQYLILSGENVDLDIMENYDGGVLTLQRSFEIGPDSVVLPPVWDSTLAFPGAGDHEEIYVPIIRLAGEDTYRTLLFAKVTGDDATLTAELIDGEYTALNLDEGNLDLTLDGVLYEIAKTMPNPDGDFQYIIFINSGDYRNDVIWIDVDEDNVSLGMSIDGNPLAVTVSNELGVVDPFNTARVLTDGDLYDGFYDDIMDVYEDVVVDVFGLDYFKIGNYVRDSYFENLVSPKTLTATVDIEPWTAYVAVPDNIVTDPPKTGDAASIMGFVMVALAGSGAITLKKRG